MKQMAQVRGGKRQNHPLIFPVKDMLWLLPGVVLYCLCWGIPYLSALLGSLLHPADFQASVSLENYRTLFRDSFYWLSLKNTLIFLFLVLGMALLLSILLAHTLYALRPLQPLVILLLVPFFLPSSSLAALWRAMLGNSSWLVQLLHPRDEVWKIFSLLLLFLWKHLGATVGLLLAGLNGIDPAILSAGELDGASRRQLLCKIELPLLKPVVTFAVIYLLMNGVRIFRESYLLYGGYPPMNLFFVQHYINGYFARLDDSLLSSAAVVFSHIVLALFWMLWSVLRKGDRDET